MPESGVNVTARFVKAEADSSIALRVKGVEVGTEPSEESASGRHVFSMGGRRGREQLGLASLGNGGALLEGG